MIFIILAWVFWFLFCFNLGYFILKLLLRDHPNIDLFYNFWFGLFFLVIILEFVSLLSPLNGKVFLFLIIFNFLLLILNIKNIGLKGKIVLTNLKKIHNLKTVILMFVVLALFIAYLSNLPVTWYDTFLYHLNSVKWLADYGTVRGLANLHVRLGLNNVTFLIAAIMSQGIFVDSASHVMNSFLLFVFVTQTILSMLKKSKNNLIYTFGLFSLLILSIFIGQINSLSTDLSLAILVLVSIFYTLISDRDKLIMAVPLFALAATTKYSYFIALMLFLLFILIELKEKLLSKKNIYFLLFTVVFFAGFILRNLILSGWAFFPLPFFGINFKWQVPVEIARNFNNEIKAWARLPGSNYLSSLNVNFWVWFKNWFYSNASKNYSDLYHMFLLLPLTLVYFFSRNKLKKQLNLLISMRKIDFLILANLVALLYTFLAAPDFRFMSIYIYVAISLISLTLIVDFLKYHYFKDIITWFFIILCFGNLFKTIAARKPELFSVQKEEGYLVKIVSINYQDQSFYVWKPVNGDQCGNSQLPCTPYDVRIKMFRPGDVKDGFYPTKEIAQ